jgi:hypothetical protein
MSIPVGLGKLGRSTVCDQPRGFLLDGFQAVRREVAILGSMSKRANLSTDCSHISLIRPD